MKDSLELTIIIVSSIVINAIHKEQWQNQKIKVSLLFPLGKQKSEK